MPNPTPSEEHPDKYQHFADLYGKDTKEVFRPSYVENLDAGNKKLLVKEKGPRNSQMHKLWDASHCIRRQEETERIHQYKSKRSITFVLCHYFYPDHTLENLIVTRRMIKCSYTLELQYFSSGKYPNVCYWCGQNREFSLIPDNLKDKFRTMYPLCKLCEGNKKKCHTRFPIKRGKSAWSNENRK